MKDYDKYIKILLLKLNKSGVEVNYEVHHSYSEKFDCMITNCYLKFWHSKIIIDEETGEEIKKNWCNTKEFKGVTKYSNIIKYLQACLKGEVDDE